MFATLVKAGPIGILILLASVFALAAFFERFIRLHQARIDINRFLKELSYWLRERNVEEALHVAERVESPAARIARAGLLHVEEGREKLTNRIEEVALVEIPELESRMGILSTVAHIAPLLGLLGTVSGMIQAFQVIQLKAVEIVPGDLAGGIWEALLTTALGLMVAIPCIIGYNYLRNLIQTIRNDMERTATVVMDFALSTYAPENAARTYESRV